MTIRDWPATERPREKLQQQGSAALSDAELLAILLGTGNRKADVLTLCRELLTSFDGLGGLLTASAERLMKHAGIGPARVNQLHVVLELSRRYLKWQLTRSEGFTEPKMVRDYLTTQLRHQPREVFAILLLDSQHRLIHYQELFAGTINAAPVYPREVLKQVMQYNAAAVILAHNHPSGVAEPSQADQRVTERLKKALALVDVMLLDHFIVGSGDPVSFAERGLL